MSTTTSMTSTGTTRDYFQVLANYDLHHSGELVTPTFTLPPNLLSQDLVDGRTTLDWPRDHQRIPIYRPIDRNLSIEARPRGRNLSENIFITVMLNGCGINANMACLWGLTGGKIFDRIFYYKIGGEK